MKKISVIIPCYNVEKYIDRCLTSITVQTIGITPLEIICVDDCSIDHTLNHLKAWEERFPENILLIQCPTNGRQGRARNIGLDYASAEWISFIDADDWIEPDYFEKLLAPTIDNDFDVVSCQNKRDSSTELTFFEDRSTGKQNRSMHIDSIEKRKAFFNLQSAGYAAWGKLIKKSILIDNRIFFPENLAYEDSYWGPLFHFYANSLYIVEEKLYHYFINPNSTVLANDADYHTDWLTVQSMKWEEWKKRDLLSIYRDELEYDFLCTCYLGFIKILSLRYRTPSYSLFQLVKEMTLERILDYRNNPYTKEGFKENQRLLLQALYLPLNKEEFTNLIELVKKIGV